MRIVNLEEFRQLPNGTLYSRYIPCCFDGLEIKKETWEVDFIYQDLIGNIVASSTDEFVEILDNAENKGTSFKLQFDACERDGLFENDQLFAIYEKEDVVGLRDRLNDILEEAYDL